MRRCHCAGRISRHPVPWVHNGINCPNKYCTACSYPLRTSAFEEIKAAEEKKFQALQDKYENEISSMREEMQNKFQQILTKIDVRTLK
jgi:integrase/recombinase XerD